ncbi:MAG: di-heme-cytochrome C peroxidase [Acidobacteriota bacterium]
MTDFERPLPTEAADISEIAQGILILQSRFAREQRRPLARGTHAKGICARAELKIFDVANTVRDRALAARLARGLFAHPGVYPAVVRFANGQSHVFPDSTRDVRALSFAVQVPPGVVAPDAARLDYAMNNATTFPINDARAFATLIRFATAPSKFKGLLRVLGGRFPAFLRAVLRGRQQTRPATRAYQQIRYWSCVPFRHGPDEAVKYSATPALDNPAHPLQHEPDCLQNELLRHLSEDEEMSSFDISLQFLDAERMTHWGRRRDPSFWIENASIEWKETESPFYPVARLTLLPNSQFSPGEAEAQHIDVTENSTPDCAPLGSINRARWGAESASRKARLDGSGASAATSTAAVPPTGNRLRVAGKIFATAALLLSLAFVAAATWVLWPVAKEPPARLQYPPTPLGSNGLTAEERQQYYHLTEGGEAFPIAWLLALEQTVKDASGAVGYRPFLENMERFGFIPDPPGPYNPYGLPVGLTMGYSQLSGLQMMGLNCTACHNGELHYNGRAFRVDGGPSLAFINSFVVSLVAETQATIADRPRLARFLDRRRRVKLVPIPSFPVVEKEDTTSPAGEPDEVVDGGNPGLLHRVIAGLRELFDQRNLVAQKLQTLKALDIVKQANAIGTLDGNGRNDAFGVGRNELFGGYTNNQFTRGVNAVPPDAPVSFPHLWGMKFTSWYQWGVNTNSVIQRNIGQALGVGATYDPAHGYDSTVRLDHLHAMETLQYRLTPPQWPDALFGAIDQTKAARGKATFDRTCALCHETYTKTGELNEYQLFPLDVVGTDPSTAINFERMVMTNAGPKPFGAAAFEIVDLVKEAYYKKHNIAPDTQARWEERAARPKPEFRTPLRDYDQYLDTRTHGVYRAKTLKGIWATAPYLHNGSVPTLYDLLLPASQRPKTFRLGTREYDPVKLGYMTDGDRFITPPGMEAFFFDTHLSGNWNVGHEWWFYPDLTDPQRYEIIEFLKTFNQDGDYQFARPAAAQLPANLRASVELPLRPQAGP